MSKSTDTRGEVIFFGPGGLNGKRVSWEEDERTERGGEGAAKDRRQKEQRRVKWRNGEGRKRWEHNKERILSHPV